MKDARGHPFNRVLAAPWHGKDNLNKIRLAEFNQHLFYVCTDINSCPTEPKTAR